VGGGRSHRRWAPEGDTADRATSRRADLVRRRPRRGAAARLAHGIGWTVALRAPDELAPLAARLRAAWDEAGRAGAPEIVAMHYFALGDDASVDYLLDYYGHEPDRAPAIAAGALRSPEQAVEMVRAFRDLGIDEYLLVPTMADLGQLHRLADAVLA
jgi:alkanesulfonate monooxygenase SsuD/methylene tetrahydromethanopterin reductase-like flavin-dependent oxidoreductase (luciferase family)